MFMLRITSDLFSAASLTFMVPSDLFSAASLTFMVPKRYHLATLDMSIETLVCPF